jgi:uncharacterized protein (TIGR02246 family)
VTDDERKIRRIIAAQASGWNAADARAFGAACQETVAFTNILGMRWNTRDAFVTRHDAMFHGPFAGSRLTIEVERLSFPAPETAVAELLTVLTGFLALPPGIQASRDGALRTRMLEVFVRADGRWEIAACHNTAVAPDADAVT